MIMKKNVLIAVAAAAFVLVFTAFKATNAGEPVANDQAKSLAWFVANIQEARKQNQQCHDDPSIQSSPECVNALHALEISFKGNN